MILGALLFLAGLFFIWWPLALVATGAMLMTFAIFKEITDGQAE